MVNGLVRPDTGEIRIGENPLLYDRESLAGRRRKTGYAIQEHGLFPHLDAFENVTLPGKLEGWSPGRKRERAEFLFHLVALGTDKYHRFPHELSGGEKQRVGLCRALFLDPPVLLLDEAFGALDPPTRAVLHQEFLQIQQKMPRTILLITHDLSEAFHLADRIVLLRKGEVILAAPASEVHLQTGDPYIQEYFFQHGTGDRS